MAKKIDAPSVTTDLLDYALGDTATLTASNFIVSSTLGFQVLHVTAPGDADGMRTAGADFSPPRSTSIPHPTPPTSRSRR